MSFLTAKGEIFRVKNEIVLKVLHRGLFAGRHFKLKLPQSILWEILALAVLRVGMDWID